MLEELEKQQKGEKPSNAKTPSRDRKQPRARKTQRLSSQASSSLFAKGLSLYRAGDYPRSVVFFLKVENSSSKHSRKARKYRKKVQEFERSFRKGRRAASSGSISPAIASLTQAYQADRVLGGAHRQKVGKLLSRMCTLRGKSALNSKDYATAGQYFKKAIFHNPQNSEAKNMMAKLRSAAKRIFEEASVLKDVDNNEARNKFKQVLKMLPSNDPLYQKAKQNLN